MVAVGIFSAAMLALLVVVLIARPMIRRRAGLADQDLPQIKTIAIHNLSPKQRLAVVRVGNEDLLLGITPTGISLIRNLNEAKAAHVPQLPASAPMASTQRVQRRVLGPAATPQPKTADELRPVQEVMKAYRQSRIQDENIASPAIESSTSSIRAKKTGEQKTNGKNDNSTRSVEDVTK
jgi:flagellar biogenesis protein FliO